MEGRQIRRMGSVDSSLVQHRSATRSTSVGLVDVITTPDEMNAPPDEAPSRSAPGSPSGERQRYPSFGTLYRLNSGATTTSSMSPGVSKTSKGRRTLRGLQKNFSSAKQEEGTAGMGSFSAQSTAGQDLERRLSNMEGIPDLPPRTELPVVTVESKITTAQLERVKTRRTKKEAGKVEKETPTIKRNFTMPSRNDIELRFNAILEALDLPEEQYAELQLYTLERKWQMICDHNSKSEDTTHTPRFFSQKLWAVVADHNFKDASQLIKRMEVILRSAQINWLNVFLSPAVNGLNAITSVLENMQVAIKRERSKAGTEKSVDKTTLANQEATAKMERSKNKATMKVSHNREKRLTGSASTVSVSTQKGTSRFRRSKRGSNTEVSDLNLPFDYPQLAHEIMLVLRAVMNTEVGFMAVAEHKSALNTIAACLYDTHPRTQIVVLEMLTAVCMVENIHLRVVEAMDFTRKMFHEEFRFQRLVQSMKYPPEVMTHDYMIALLNFFNVVVHASPNVNFRVHLQYDLTSLGFDECLGDLLQRDDLEPLMQKQINAYVDNFFDVQTLLDNLDNPTVGRFNNNADIQMENERLKEELTSTETRYVAKIAELEDNLRDMRRTIELLTNDDHDGSRRLSMLSVLTNGGGDGLLDIAAAKDTKDPRRTLTTTSIPDTLDVDGSKANASSEQKAGDSSSGDGITPSASSDQSATGGPAADGDSAPRPAAPPPVLPPPPPPPSGIGAPPPPPGIMPPGMQKPSQRKVITTKYKMPALNWQVIRNATWSTTIFAHIDADFHQHFEVSGFEDKFKLKNQPNDASETTNKFTPKNVKTAKVLDANFCRNLGILQRKLNMSGKELAEKVNKYDDMTDLSDSLGQLLKLTPTDQELQKLERHEKNNTTKTLSEEEVFICELYRVPRFTTKLRIIVYMMNFDDVVNRIQPQMQALFVACSAVTSSQGLKKIYELLLTLGNFTNSSRRGWTTGFQVISLDSLKSMKSTDGTMTLIHWLADYVQERKEYSNIINELVGLDRAVTVLLSQISSEISQLVSGLLLVRAESKRETGKNSDLTKFLDTAKQTVPELERLYERAQEAFGEVIVYLGETPKNQTPSEIIGPLARFIRNLQSAAKENEEVKKKTEEKAKKAVILEKQRETAEALSDIMKAGGNPLGGSRPPPTSGNRHRMNTFMDDMINASKTVAYRADLNAR